LKDNFHKNESLIDPVVTTNAAPHVWFRCYVCVGNPNL